MIKIGVIGIGFGTKVHIPGLKSEGFEVAAVCSRRLEKAEQAAAAFGIPAIYSDYRKMLQHPGLEAVSIATATDLNHPITLAALEAGKHVLCEKPFAINEQQAEEMWRSWLETGLTGMIDHEFRFDPVRAFAKSLIEQGYIGKLHNINISLFPKMGRRHTQSALTRIGCHYIDCIRDWFGEISGVCGRGFNVSLPLAAGEGKHTTEEGVPLAFSFIVAFAGGGWGAMTCNLANHFGSGTRFEIYGSEGVLSMLHPGGNPTRAAKVFGARVGDEQVKELEIPSSFRSIEDDRDPRLAAFRHLARRFRDGIQNGTSPSPNFYDGFRCQQIIDAIENPATSGIWVEIQPPPYKMKG